MTLDILTDLTGGTLTREDGHFIKVAERNPYTLLPWVSEDEIEAALQKLADGGLAWLAPQDPAEPEPVSVTPVQFKLLWTIQERLALKELRATDPIVDDFWEILDDPRLETLRLDLKSTQDGIAYCLSKLVEGTVLTEAEAATRAEQISSGVEV